jgi:hypothetical protein
MREGYTLWQHAAMRLMPVALVLVCLVPSAAAADDAPRELIDEAKALLVVGACADGTPPPGVKAKTVQAHCRQVRKAQDAYRQGWVVGARDFFATHVPKHLPKTVVYPFAGGDLSTALTVYPDADEITTLSLEPAGDPRALSRLADRQLRPALATVARELASLYRSSYSKTMNMIVAMRGAKLPTQLIFGLSALAIHGYEPMSMRYFRVTPQGDIEYLTDADFAAIDKIADVGKRNRALSNVELRFRKLGATREQTYRHVMANLDDGHLQADPAALLHLQKKGKVAGMTKAASYLLSFRSFSTMRKYIIDHVDWMVSDSTGLPPKHGLPAGFEYETHGSYEASNMPVGKEVTPQWRALYLRQPKRRLSFRFGYPDHKLRGHLIIMRRAQM